MEKVPCIKLGHLLSSPPGTCMCTRYSWVLILLCYPCFPGVLCLTVSSRDLTPTHNHPVRAVPEGEGKRIGAKFSLGLFPGSAAEGAVFARGGSWLIPQQSEWPALLSG